MLVSDGASGDNHYTDYNNNIIADNNLTYSELIPVAIMEYDF